MLAQRRSVAVLGGGVCLVLAAACAPTSLRPQARPGTAAALPDTAGFGDRLAAHLALPAAEQAAAPWRAGEAAAAERSGRLLRGWWYAEVPDQTRDLLGVALGNGLQALRRATDLDPSFAEGWGGLGHLALAAGDAETARRTLRNARVAARARREADRALPRDDELRIHRDLAWACYDLARYDAGLGAVAAGRELAADDQELMLLEGLLLAGAGRGVEAMSVAARLPPVRFPYLSFTFAGLQERASSYANNWIRAMALLAEGRTTAARHALGELELYSYRIRLPHGERFWRDAGLVAELAGDPKAPLWYAVGHLSRPYQDLLPVATESAGPQVADLPHARMPVFTSYGRRFYAGGSPLSYVGLQVNLRATALTAERQFEATARALHMLDILARRGVAPLFCHAVRGRLRFAHDDFAAARGDLEQARALLLADGRADAVTSLMLGLIALRDERYQDAALLLAEATTADPAQAAAWRALGVARAKLGREEAAAAAFNRAVALEPHSLTGYYNRGLFHLQRRAFGAAAADLARAYELDPDNREVQRLLQMAVGGARAAGEVVAVHDGPPAGFKPDQDALLATMQQHLDELFTVPDSLRVDDAAATARIVGLEHAYARDGDPELRRVLALAYLDHGRHREVQLLLGPAWGLDLAPEEELMLLYADHALGERQRADELTRSLLAGEPGSGNPYAWALAALMIRDNDPRGGQSEVTKRFLHYCAGTKAKSYGFPPLDKLTTWMRDGFSNAREYRLRHGIPDPEATPDWFSKTYSGRPADAGATKSGTVR